MTKHKKFRILGVVVLLLTVLSIGLISPTYANPWEGWSTEEELTCEDLAERYGLYIEEGDREGTFDVFREGSYAEACGNEEGNNIPLQITHINGNPIENGPILQKAGDEATITASYIKSGEAEYITVMLKNLQPPEGQEAEVITVKYEVQVLSGGDVPPKYEDNLLYNDPETCVAFRNEVAGMDANAQNFYKSDLSYCWNSRVPAGTNYTKEQLQTKISRSKATWAAYTSTTVSVSQSFQQEFDRIKANAERKGNSYNTGASAATKKTLKCNYQYLPAAGKTYTNAYGETINKDGDIVLGGGNVISDGSSSYAYMNKDYYYATDINKFGSVEYVYNYAPGKSESESHSDVCTRTCRESVKVEYGAPIASKAGLCFSYQVKITSYVLCDSTFDAPQPKQPGTCSPGVRCTSPSGTVRGLPQAGPTEDYEQCINKCDGGKYTQNCSVKCYNEVYAKSGKKEIKLSLTPGNGKVQQLASRSDYSMEECKAEHDDGCYGYNGNTIYWSSNASYDKCSRSSLGRYYNDIGYGTLCRWSNNRQYIADHGGFMRGDYGSALCDDNCVWTSGGCSGKYLNPNTGGKDYNANIESYDKARLECLAAATCTSKTANITISIKYDTTNETTGNAKTETVNFPISLGSDKVTSRGDGVNVQDTFSDKFSTLLDRKGCYVESKSNELEYMVEWSFPGTYIHNKTGEITFKVPSDSSGWYYEDNKFCMPLDARSVNTKWWEWYKITDMDFDKSCYSQAEIEAELNSTTNSNGYNILAAATNFGHFGWNFDISCFYGLKNEICDVDTVNAAGKMCCPNPPGDTCGTNGTSCYIVRTIDREDLFPNAPLAGTESNDTREIGFNWTDAAKITGTKNPDYQVDPVELIQQIQNNAHEIYNNDDVYLDYQFYLTPQTLRKIKEYNSRYDYDQWMGKVVETNGVNVYLSNLWNSAQGSIEGNINLRNITGAVLKTGDPGVNNQ